MSWIDQDAGEVVLSTRIRVSRNLKDEKFGPLSAETLENMKERLKVRKGNWSTWELRRPGDLESLEKQILSERGQLEPEFALQSKGYLAVSPAGDQTLSLGDGDHLRLGIISGGEALENSYQGIFEPLCTLEELFPPAFDRELGYLRADPRQCGTGMKPSVLVHLPASELGGMITEVFKQAESQGYSVRGLWDSEEEGPALYQISPYFSTGSSEEGSLGQLTYFTEKIISWETKARELLMDQQSTRVADLCGRAYGILLHCSRLGITEALTLISRLRLGIIVGIIKSVPLQSLTSLWYTIQKGHLRSGFPEDGATEEDILRARLVKNRLMGQ